MGRIIRFLFQLFFAALAVIVLTVVWICFDGLNDLAGKTDAVLAVADPAKPAPALDRAAKLYTDGNCTMVIVCGTGEQADFRSLQAMRQYLAAKGVPGPAIIMEGNGQGSITALADNAADVMKQHGLKTITLVESYINITRTKLVLYHAGVEKVHKAHTGGLRKEDSLLLVNEVYLVFDYVGRTYLAPGMSKLKKEAEIAADKAKAEAHDAKKSVDHSLDTMPK